MNKAEIVFEKIAKLDVDSIEDTVGFYLGDKQEQAVRSAIQKHKSKSFVLRHPVLTGIPTLGMAPGIAQSRAKKQIITGLARSDKGFRKAMETTKNRRRKERLENYELETNRIKAEQPTAAITAGGAAMSRMMDSYTKSKKNNAA
jgi:hypothetical protein